MLLVGGSLFVAACGSTSAEAGEASSSSSSDLPETSVVGHERDDNEIVSVPFTVIAEDLEVGDPPDVNVVADAKAFDGLALDGSEIDFSTHVVFVFDLAESSTPACEFQPTAQLVFDEPHQRLYPAVLANGQSSSDDTVLCRFDAGPHRIALSVARSDLPPSAFSLWVNGDDPPACCADRLLFVAEGELTRIDGQFPPLDAQGTLAVGETRILYGLSTHCGVDPIYQPIDGSQWVASDPTVMAGIDSMPAGWPSGRPIDLVVERTGQDTLTATASGTEISVAYERSFDRLGCG